MDSFSCDRSLRCHLGRCRAITLYLRGRFADSQVIAEELPLRGITGRRHLVGGAALVAIRRWGRLLKMPVRSRCLAYELAGRDIDCTHVAMSSITR